MPSVQKGESEQDYVSRAIPILIKEGKSQEQAAAIAYSMYKEKKNDTEELPIEAKIIQFFIETENITDELLQEFADSNNMTPQGLQTKIIQLIECFLKGGSKSNTEIPEDELKKGIEEEKEHIQEGNPFAELLACKITIDHLAKDNKYYEKSI